ncbi:MAG: stage II sporulation protein M [Prevotella sp.]|nr:stage II sporulation protein M [Prevotella sp.]
MKEIVFLRNNLPKWRRAEQVVGDTYWHTPDELADLYGDITSDLSFAQTHYPDSRITLYLNNLASAIHNEIYKNKREKLSRLLTFWTREVPLTMWEARRLLLVSSLISVVSALIGMVSQLADPEYCRIILGDSYVDMTLDNIMRGEPMAVYDGGGETEMFLGITLNNVFVSFRMFVLGILTSVGTAWSLFQNLDMLGCFMTFFYQHGLLWEAFLAVFLHGTLEISAIIIAGAAGLSLGNGLLFPGTYSRMVSFRRGARKGLKIIVGTVPVFIVAGFIEGFITRHTEIFDSVRLAIILLSLAFVLWYFVILPRIVARKR